MYKKLKIAIIGSRGYPYVYSGYETLVKELSERLVKSGNEVTVYCHRKLYNEKPKNVIISNDYPVVISKFITDAKEIEIDAVADMVLLNFWLFKNL